MRPSSNNKKFSLPGRGVGIRNISDYSPFGVLLLERTVESAFFRTGFQGQEHDDEVKGEGNSVNFKYRMHDPRVGRFFAVDPLSSSYPELTPYQFSSNSPIFMIEFEGLEGKIAVTTKWYTNKGIEKSKTKYYTVDGLKADLIKICWKPHGNPNGPVVSIDYYGRMEDGTRSGNSLKGVNPDAKPTVSELNAFFASDPNNSFNVNKEKKAQAAADKAEEEFDNSYGGKFYNNVLADGALEGGSDPVNLGTLSSQEEKILEVGGKIILVIGQTIGEGIQKVAFPLLIVPPEILPGSPLTAPPTLISTNNIGTENQENNNAIQERSTNSTASSKPKG